MRSLIVDGHSVIYAWPELRRQHQAKPALARDRLVESLQKLQDASDWQITIVFDGKKGPAHVGHADAVRVLYASEDQTADSVIEKLVGASGSPARMLIVTADRAERSTTEALGAETVSPAWLEAELENRLASLEERLQRVSRASRR